MPEPGRLC